MSSGIPFHFTGSFPRHGAGRRNLLVLVLAVLVFTQMACGEIAGDSSYTTTAAPVTATTVAPSTTTATPTITKALPSTTAVLTDTAAPTTTAVPTSTEAPTTTGAPSTTLADVSPKSEGLVLKLRLADESDGGVAYDRDLYGSWTQVRSGCNTRCSVLEEERSDGTWLSWYDGKVAADPSDLDIDHMVPLAEAHSSGGWQWNSSQKRQYANDLIHPQALTAVSASSNRSKGSRDPAEWKPSDRSVWCEYATDWIKVKTVWDLTADQTEVRELKEMLNTCESTVTLTTVPVTNRVAPITATTNAPAASAGNGSCPYTSSSGDPCSEVPALGNTSDDVNCGDIPRKYKPLTVTGQDFDRLDGDKDGEACS